MVTGLLRDRMVGMTRPNVNQDVFAAGRRLDGELVCLLALTPDGLNAVARSVEKLI